MVVLRSQKAALERTPSNVLESHSVITVKSHELSKHPLPSSSPRCVSASSSVVYHRRSSRIASKLNQAMNVPSLECKVFVEEDGEVGTHTVEMMGRLVTEEGCDLNAQGVEVLEHNKRKRSEKENMSCGVEHDTHAANLGGKRKLNGVLDTELGNRNMRVDVVDKLKKVVIDCSSYSDCEGGMEGMNDLKGDTKLRDEREKYNLAEGVEKEQTLGSVSSTETSDTIFDIDGNENIVKNLSKEVMIQEDTQVLNRRFSVKQKGKCKLDEAILVSNDNALDLNVEFVETGSIDNDVPAIRVSAALQGEQRAPEITNGSNSSAKPGLRKRFRDIARKNAHRFAHFDPQDEENNSSVANANAEAPLEEAKQEIGDWPGPFSTAMKIIRDRALAVDNKHMSSSDRTKPDFLMWKPQHKNDTQSIKILVPSLQELSMAILVKNVEAISSLEGIPDELRNKLSHSICDSRRMTRQFMELLFIGSPTEIRIWDCSWLTEEQFPIVFKGCDTQNLTVLQLDFCGQCMPDYILQSTLAHSSHSLPSLTSISLKGAYRLSDVGLKALCNSAPHLKSINLTHCSFLTSTCIDILADSLESVLVELIVDECDNLDAMRILPALINFENLEVLSVASIHTVCDDFIQTFITVRGQNLKKLTLSGCVGLSDSSLKVISKKCSRLCSLDLTNVNRLTDSALGYLANGCCPIQNLKLDRIAFSDEAVAAFVETCGASLIELSLNNVTKISSNTAMSLANYSRKLVSLDVSFCRNLTDDAMGLIVDSCSSLRDLRLFGCTQITSRFLNGYFNMDLKILGIKLTPLFDHSLERNS